jgi:hypothetical protein
MANQYLKGVIQIPSMLLITGVTRSYPMIVTFTVPSTGSNTYKVNQLVRLTIPYTWGMSQANGLTGRILYVDSTTMQLDIDSNYFDAFVDGSSSKETPASLAPAGSQNLEINNTSRQVPFQSLNNIGN